MSRIVQEWIEKAEGDFLTATRELHASVRNVIFQRVEVLLQPAVRQG
jgi:hypothetical protein